MSLLEASHASSFFGFYKRGNRWGAGERVNRESCSVVPKRKGVRELEGGRGEEGVGEQVLVHLKKPQSHD